MKKLKLMYKDRYIENIDPETTLYEISKEIKGEYKYPIVGARLGEYLVDLNAKVTKNDNVEFYDLSSSIGNRMYARSLEFLVTVASKKVMGEDTDILINYSLENGIYCEITGKKITGITIKKIEEEMRRFLELLVNVMFPLL